MALWIAILLGATQGVTEFLPISSSGHLAILGTLADLNNHFIFDVLLNIGTLAALIFYTRKQLLSLVQGLFSKNWNVVAKLAIATLPAAVIGVIFRDGFEELNTNLAVVITMLIVIGIVMTQVRQKAKAITSIEGISWLQAGIVGLAQAIALVPGTSRSGITILAALLVGMNIGLAARWSFLMAIPIISGAIIVTLFSREGVEFVSSNYGSVVAGNITSFIVGMLSIAFLLQVLEKHSLRVFGMYRIALGMLLIALLSVNIL